MRRPLSPAITRPARAACSVLLGALLAGGVVAIGCSSDAERPTPPAPKPDGGTDARPDSSIDARDSTVTEAGDAPPPDAPPPIEDGSELDDLGLPPPGSRVEGTIGPEGGTLSGTSGTALAGVSLVVPSGALSAPVTFAIDAAPAPTGPGGAKLASPYVRVGPDGVAFAVAARLTLPWTSTVASPQLAAVARIGFSWSSLQDPTGDATSVTASMRRTSGAAIALLDLSSLAPKITAASSADAGSALFVEGSGFGLAQVLRPGVDGGASFVSNVTVGGVVAETLGWSDTAISVRAPLGDGGAITVATPGGSVTAP